MSEPLVVESHRGRYRVSFVDDGPARAESLVSERTHFLVDRRVAGLYGERMPATLAGASVLLLDADEESKSLERFPAYVEHLVARGVRRDHVLVAVGGGVIQDITSFLAATLLRGVEWRFLPTTLLAQADSCIGSKSSINVGGTKNILGTFTPPREIFVDTAFLDTLDARDVRSGVGEILKVHAIEGPDAFDGVARDYPRLLEDRALLRHYVRRALEIKRRYIEEDEFDRGVRNVFNYGHTFGHAIEAATAFGVPHGIAVTIGMDLANFMALRRGELDEGGFRRMHPVLAVNYAGFEATPVPMDRFMSAIARDKKNVGDRITVILPGADGRPGKRSLPNDAAFRDVCREYLEAVRGTP